MSLKSPHSQRVWESLARREAYYAVLTEDDYLQENLNEQGHRRFLETGREDVERFLRLIGLHIDRSFQPRHVLEFGCGVGRLLLALADIAEEVTGIDVSQSMLDEALKNFQREGKKNFRLLSSKDGLGEPSNHHFDFILSYIVFQHIRPAEGLSAMKELLCYLKPEGVGLFHIAISGGMGHLGKILQRSAPGSALLNFLRGRKLSDPMIEMYPYPLKKVLTILHQAGISSIHVELTNHGGEIGAILLFRKSPVTDSNDPTQT